MHHKKMWSALRAISCFDMTLHRLAIVHACNRQAHNCTAVYFHMVVEIVHVVPSKGFCVSKLTLPLLSLSL